MTEKIRCIYPRQVTDNNGLKLYVSCGHCILCKKRRAREWAFRLKNEALSYGDKVCVLTLTYDDEHLPEDLSLHKRDVQLFMKRLRKKRDVRYFYCGEYGDLFGRPHYHVIIFGVGTDDPLFQPSWPAYHGRHCNLVMWPYGLTHVAAFSFDYACYVSGYVNKKLFGKDAKAYKEAQLLPPFVCMSTHPMIGDTYARNNLEFISNGSKLVSIPRSYRRKFGILPKKEDLEKIMVDNPENIYYDYDTDVEHWLYRRDQAKLNAETRERSKKR